ncbi:MAG TPA: O-antigen ligase family protein [Candidatus Paceibacterota bacterium]|nr:O-antigen ligase family protein [Candidatus Paceibacterota bacterium]
MNLNKTLQYIVIGCLGLVLAVPLYVSNEMFFPYIAGKNFAFRALVEIALVAYLFLAWRDARFRPKASGLMWSLLVFVVIVGVANIFSENPYKSFWSNYERMEGYIALLHLGAFAFIASNVFRTTKEWLWYAVTSLSISAIMLLVGLSDAIGGLLSNGVAPRINVMLGNSTYVGAYFFIHAGILLLIAVSDKKVRQEKWRIAAYAVGIIAFIAGVFFTGTRGTVLGILGGSFVAGIFLAIYERNHPLLKKIAAGMVIGVTALVGLFFLLKDTGVVQNVSILRRFTEVTLTNAETQARPTLWKMAFEGVKDRPIFGWGQESFNYIFSTYYDPAIYSHEQWFDRSHNMFIEWLVTTGIVGFLAYIALIAMLGYTLWKIPGDRLSILQKSVFTGILVGYFIHNLFVFDNLASYILFFGILAFFHSQIVPRDVVSKKGNAEAGDSVLKTQVMLVCAVLSLVVVPYTLYAGTYKPYAANRSLLSALRIMAQPPKTQAEQMANFEATKMYFDKALSYDSFGNQEIREQYITNAVNVASQAGAGNEVGMAFLNDSRLAGQDQIEESPNDPRAYYILSTSYSRTGEIDKAMELIRKAQELSPKKQMFISDEISFLLTQDKFEEAFKRAEYAVSVQEKNISIEGLYVVTALYSNRDQLAFDTIEKYPQVMENSGVVQALLITGHTARVLPVLEAQVAELKKQERISPTSHILLAAARLEVGNRKGALELLAELKTQAATAGNTQIVQEITSYEGAINAGTKSIIPKQ